MKRPNTLLKAAAVVSSLLLVGGFVSYRAGAFNRLLAPSPRPEEPAASEQPPLDTTPPAPTILYSSKYAVFGNLSSPITPSDPPPAISEQPPPDTTPTKPTIMSGSKSFLDADYLRILQLIDMLDAQPPAPSQPSTPPK